VITTRRFPVSFLALALALALAACGGGGGGSSSGGGVQTPPLTDLDYPTASTRYLLGIAIEPNRPTIVGEVDEWTVDPAFPAGIELDPVDGTIHGTPAETARLQAYKVTATNAVSSLEFDVEFDISPAARMALVAHRGDATISTHTVDPETSDMAPVGYQAVTNALEDVVVHPGGVFVYALRPATIAVLRLDRDSGNLSAETTAANVVQPRSMRIDPDGKRAYVAAFGTGSAGADGMVHAFTIDAATGLLTELGTAQPLAAAARLALDPEGKFLVAASHGATSALVAFSIDASGLAPAAAPLGLGGSEASDLAFHTAGERLYATIDNFGLRLLSTFALERQSGALTVEGTKQVVRGPSSVAVHPGGSMVYVTSANVGDTGSIALFPADPATGELDAALQPIDRDGEPRHVAIDAAGRHAFVCLEASGEVARYSIDPETFELDGLGSIGGRSGPARLALVEGSGRMTPFTPFAYALSQSDRSISAYAFHPDQGDLAEIGAPVFTDEKPVDMEVDPFGRYLYVAAETTRTINIFRIQDDGSLDASALPQDLLAGKPVDLAIDPSGRFVVFGANDIGGAGVEPAAIFVYTIDHDAARAGELDFRAARPIASDILAVQVGPSGRFIYVGLQDEVVVLRLLPDGGIAPGELTLPLAGANSGFSFSRSGAYCYVEIPDRDLVGALTVSNSDGSLAAIANRPTSTSPIDVLVHPKGSFALVAISNGPARNGGLDSFRVEPDGSLGDVIDQDLDPVNPFDIEFSGGGSFLFAANEAGHEVVVYDVNGDEGTLRFRSAAAAGTSPVDVAVVRAFR